jgi:hypothetical protein
VLKTLKPYYNNSKKEKNDSPCLLFIEGYYLFRAIICLLPYGPAQ